MVVINLNDSNRSKRIIICGLPGSGKTNFAKFLIAGVNPKNRVVIWDANGEYTKIPRNCDRYIPTNKQYSPAMIEEFNLFIDKLVFTGKRPKVLLIDEANMLFPAKKTLIPKMAIILNTNRHLKMNLIFVTRRPRSLHTDIIELSELFIFRLSGLNDEQFLREVKKGLDDLVINRLEDYKCYYVNEKREIKKLAKVPYMG
jgi:DNA helicase HerA-like ATPase